MKREREYAGEKERKKEKGEGTGGDFNAPHVPVCAAPPSPFSARGSGVCSPLSTRQTQFQDISRARSISDVHLNARWDYSLGVTFVITRAKSFVGHSVEISGGEKKL